VRDGVWDPVLRKLSWPQGRTSLIQVYDGNMAVLFHLLGNTQPGPGLVRLLADPTKFKVGVAIRGDALKLVRDFSACAVSPPAGLLELSRVARLIEPERWRGAGGLVALARLCQGYLGRDLDKGSVRYGAWDMQLDQEQIDCELHPRRG
jgi:ribonuclease D